MPDATLGYLGSFLSKGDLQQVRLTNRAFSHIFSNTPLVAYRVKILRTISGGLPDGKSETDLSKTYTLYSDKTSVLPRGDDIAVMMDMRRLYHTWNNVILHIFTQGFPDNFRLRLYSLVYTFTDDFDDRKYNFSQSEIQDKLASTKTRSYTFSKTTVIPPTGENGYMTESSPQTLIDYFLRNTSGGVSLRKNGFDKLFQEWGGLEKLLRLLTFTYTVTIHVDRYVLS